MINPYYAQLPDDLQPRCSMTAPELRREWEHMNDEERFEIYTPWLRAAKEKLGLEADASDSSLIAANYAMKVVQLARVADGWKQINDIFKIFGVEKVEFFQEPKVTEQPKQLGLFG